MILKRYKILLIAFICLNIIFLFSLFKKKDQSYVEKETVECGGLNYFSFPPFN